MKRILFAVLFTQFILYGMTGLAQTTKILYVYPEHIGVNGVKINNIRMKISQELKANLQEKFKDECPRAMWEGLPDKKGLLSSPRVDYVLMLNDMDLRGNERSIKLTFEFYHIDEAYKQHKVSWPDNEFMLQLSNSQEPMGTDKVIELVCDEIDIFIASSPDPDERKFRPRIKISMPELFAETSENVQVNTFARELNQMLDSKYSVDKKYVFYFNQRQFPKESNFEINSKIWGNQVSDHQIRIELVVNFYNDYPLEPPTIMDQKNLTDEKTVQQLANKIANVLDSQIMYYDE
ncbi:MAG: hypothetical protein P8100_11835 [bacterium]